MLNIFPCAYMPLVSSMKCLLMLLLNELKKKKKTLEMEFSIYYVHDLLSEIYDLQIFSPSAACISNLTVFLESKS